MVDTYSTGGWHIFYRWLTHSTCGWKILQVVNIFYRWLTIFYRWLTYILQVVDTYSICDWHIFYMWLTHSTCGWHILQVVDTYSTGGWHIFYRWLAHILQVVDTYSTGGWHIFYRWLTHDLYRYSCFNACHFLTVCDKIAQNITLLVTHTCRTSFTTIFDPNFTCVKSWTLLYYFINLLIQSEW